MGDEDHVVRVHSAEGGETIANDGKEGDEDGIDDVDDVNLFAADVDPA